MATWNQSINSGGLLAGIGKTNDNAPRASDINATLGMIRDNNELQRSGANNLGLQALSGLRGLADIYQADQQQQRQKEFLQKYGEARAAGDIPSMRGLFAEYPEMGEQIGKGMTGISADTKESIGSLAAGFRTAAATGSGDQFVAKNAAEFLRVGVDPADLQKRLKEDPNSAVELADWVGLSAVGYEKYFDIIGDNKDREEKIRSNQANEALTKEGHQVQMRGQSMGYQSAMAGHNLAAQRLALDQQRFGLEVMQAQQKAQELITGAPELSVNMEKSIEKSVNDATASQNSANSMKALAQQFKQEKPTTGLFGNAQNMFSKLTGSDTTLRDLRIRQNALVNSQVLKFLPPGPATDRDVDIVRQGAPTDMDNPEVVARWLDAMSNLELRNAQFNEFKSEWMSANGNPGQSRNGGQILGMDVKKGESMGAAAKRYMSQNPIHDAAPSGALQALQSDPSLASQFKAKYGYLPEGFQ